MGTPERYTVEIRHSGLNLYRRVSGTSEDVVRQTAQAALAQWEERWQRKQAAANRRAKRDQKQRTKEAERAYKEARKQEAQEATASAEEEIEGLQTILVAAATDTVVDFASLRDRTVFDEPSPQGPAYAADPPPPEPIHRAYVAPAVPFFGKILELFSSQRKSQRIQQEEADAALMHSEDASAYANLREAWEGECRRVRARNQELHAQFEKARASWETSKASFYDRQDSLNRQVDDLRERYLTGEATAVEQYCDIVLSRSSYADYFPRTFDTQYLAESRCLVVDYKLPAPEDLPHVKSVKYVAPSDELVETLVSEVSAKKTYDAVVYQVILRSLSELFRADASNVVDSIAFNGVVEALDKATGQNVTACIASVLVTKADFLALNLAAIDPKACFRRLRGVGSTELVALVPVKPIMTLSREDARFVDGREILSTVTESTNLAEMEWGEFEHLVRQILEREFAGGDGAEVKVTQASRDGGVDAVIFDPDPLHGGKYIVQAKRYNRTVPVAAVRELWGTMSHEHASKGILVTTSSFGPDAHTFASGKPITLIDGAHLLFLLQKHGTSAVIEKSIRQRAG